MATLAAHASGVIALAALGGGRLASGGLGRRGDRAAATMKIWDPASASGANVGDNLAQAGKCLADFRDVCRLHPTSAPRSGTCVAACDAQGTVWSLALVRPGGRFASGSVDATIKLWDPGLRFHTP